VLLNQACYIPNTCPNGYREGAEQCDDENTVTTDGCDACSITSGWFCNTAGNPSTCSNTCGNNAKNGTEGCDDGNVASGDGCSSTCVEETANGWACTESLYLSYFQKSTCTNSCGNGVRNSTEVCDDGNTASSDGCLNDCTAVEPGYVCLGAVGALSTCTANYCGDGLTYGAE